MTSQLAYYRCKWSFKDLQNKTVEFSFKTLGERKRKGKFEVHQYHEMISIVIIEPHLSAGHDHRFPIFDPAIAGSIEIHPDKTIADFRLSN